MVLQHVPARYAQHSGWDLMRRKFAGRAGYIGLPEGICKDMKLNVKKVVLYLIILIVPFVILFAVYPFLPTEVSTGAHLFSNSTIPKQYIFVLGFLPIFIYWQKNRK